MANRIVFMVGTVVFGAFAGAFVWAFFFLMDAGINLLWNAVPAALAQAGLPAVAYPIVFCTLGGVVIGLFAKRFGAYPQDMNTVMAQVKEHGRYEYDHVGASFFGALLPLLFGGSIGPEAGLTGVIAGLCTWVGDRLRFMGAEMRQLAEAGTAAVVSALFSTPLFGMVVPLVGAADDSEGSPVSDLALRVPRARKWAVYVLAVAGALAAMEALGQVFGAGTLSFCGAYRLRLRVLRSGGCTFPSARSFAWWRSGLRARWCWGQLSLDWYSDAWGWRCHSFCSPGKRKPISWHKAGPRSPHLF